MQFKLTLFMGQVYWLKWGVRGKGAEKAAELESVALPTNQTAETLQKPNLGRNGVRKRG